MDADDHQSVCVLVMGTAARVRAGHSFSLWTARSLSGDHDCVLNVGGYQRNFLQKREVEDEGCVTESCEKLILQLSLGRIQIQALVPSVFFQSWYMSFLKRR